MGQKFGLNGGAFVLQSLRMGSTWSSPRTRSRTYAFPVRAVGVDVKETKESVIGDIAKDRSSKFLKPSTQFSCQCFKVCTWILVVVHSAVCFFPSPACSVCNLLKWLL